MYECEDCTDCPLRAFCTKASEGTNRKLAVNTKWEQHKEYVQQKLSEEVTAAIYRQRGRFSIRGKSKVENEIGLAFMATNLRKYAIRG